MDLSEINPFPRTTGYFESWIYDDGPASAAYDLRVFAFVRSAALIILGEKEYRLPADSLLILGPGEPYHFRNADPDDPFTLYCLSFDLTQEYRGTSRFRLPVFASQFRPEFLVDQKIGSGARDISNLRLPLIVRDRPDLCERVREVARLFGEKPIYYLERCSGIIKEILFASLPEASGSEEKRQHETAGAVHAKRTLRYIEEHFREPINEKSIAAALNFHPYYLARLTMKYFDVTPYQYLTQCRIDEAVRLLLHTDKTIRDVAAECGFAGQSHFSSAVRKRTGMPPGMIRKTGMNTL